MGASENTKALITLPDGAVVELLNFISGGRRVVSPLSGKMYTVTAHTVIKYVCEEYKGKQQ